MKYMSENGFEVTMMSADGPERDAVMQQEGCPHIVVPMTRKITPFKDLYCLIILVYQFIKIRPDIVHTHTPKAGLLGMLAAYIARVPVRLHTVAGLPLMVTAGNKRKLLVFIEKLTYAGATKVLPNSKSLRKYIIDNKFCAASKLEIIGEGSSNGIKIEEFERGNLNEKTLDLVKQQIHYDPNNIYLLAVGRMVNDKGLAELVEAFEHITPQYNSRLKLILVGPKEDHLDPLPEKTIKRIDHNSDIIAVGFSDKVAYFLSIANILVHPSHREGFPNVLLQAGVMKCPIVCSDIHGNIDIVEENTEGSLFKVKNVQDLITALNYALANSVEMHHKADKLYTKIINHFDRPKVQELIRRKYVEKNSNNKFY